MARGCSGTKVVSSNENCGIWRNPAGSGGIWGGGCAKVVSSANRSQMIESRVATKGEAPGGGRWGTARSRIRGTLLRPPSTGPVPVAPGGGGRLVRRVRGTTLLRSPSTVPASSSRGRPMPATAAPLSNRPAAARDPEVRKPGRPVFSSRGAKSYSSGAWQLESSAGAVKKSRGGGLPRALAQVAAGADGLQIFRVARAAPGDRHDVVDVDVGGVLRQAVSAQGAQGALADDQGHEQFAPAHRLRVPLPIPLPLPLPVFGGAPPLPIPLPVFGVAPVLPGAFACVLGASLRAPPDARRPPQRLAAIDALRAGGRGEVVTGHWPLLSVHDSSGPKNALCFNGLRVQKRVRGGNKAILATPPPMTIRPSFLKAACQPL